MQTVGTQQSFLFKYIDQFMTRTIYSEEWIQEHDCIEAGAGLDREEHCLL